MTRTLRERRVTGALLACAFTVAAAVAVPVAAHVHLPQPNRTSVRAATAAALANPTPVTLIPGVPTISVTLGADKALHVTDAPGNAALVFIGEAMGYHYEEPVPPSDTPVTLPPTYSGITPGLIYIASKDQISISTTSYSGTPVCDYQDRNAPGMEGDPEVTHHVVCQVDAPQTDANGNLQSPSLITSTRVDLGDGNDSLTVKAIQPPEPEAQETGCGSDGILDCFLPVLPYLRLHEDLLDWNVYGGSGNDWIDVDVAAARRCTAVRPVVCGSTSTSTAPTGASSGTRVPRTSGVATATTRWAAVGTSTRSTVKVATIR